MSLVRGPHEAQAASRVSAAARGSRRHQPPLHSTLRRVADVSAAAIVPPSLLLDSNSQPVPARGNCRFRPTLPSREHYDNTVNFIVK